MHIRAISAAAVAAAGVLLAASPASASLTWTVVPTPNPSAGTNQFNGVSARTATDAWAVGSFTGADADDEGQNPLTARWDGAKWQQVAAPSVLHQDEVLNGVSADAANDAWAVGVTRVTNAAARSPLAIHWNGTAWTTVPVPNTAGGAKSQFNSVAALAPDNAWAVGRGKDAQALVEHWNGTAWTIVSVPQPTPPAGWTVTSASLSGVSSRSATDMWAVGGFVVQQGTNVQTRTLALHYNGTAWTVVPTPTNVTTTVNTVLNGVTAIAANDVWAVGQASTLNGTTLPNNLVAEHWNGTTWSVVATPASGGGLNGVAARSANDVWAVGSITDPAGTAPTTTLHWDGTAWSRVASPSGDSILRAASATPGGGDLWAAGVSANGTLILRNTP